MSPRMEEDIENVDSYDIKDITNVQASSTRAKKHR